MRITNRSRRPALAVLTTALASVLLAACGGGGGETADDGVETLSVALIPTADQAAFYYALNEGIFEKHGLDVQPEQVTSATALTAALSSGKTDLMSHSLPTTATAISSGLPFKIVSQITRMPEEGYMEVIVPADSEIEDFGDLQGKDVGIISAQGVFELAVRHAIGEAGGDPLDMEALSLPPADNETALTTGRLEAATINDPWLTPAKENEDLRSLGNPVSLLGFQMPSAIAVATEETVAERPEALAAYRDALTEASEVLAADPDAARESIASYTETEPEQLAKITLPVITTEVTEADINSALEEMRKFGWLEKELTASDIMWDGSLSE